MIFIIIVVGVSGVSGVSNKLTYIIAMEKLFYMRKFERVKTTLFTDPK